MCENDPVKARLKGIQSRATNQGVPFNLTKEWFLAHFNVCEMTGIELIFESGSPWSVEVDRKDPSKGYTMDNCRLVCSMYNTAKMEWTDADVMIMAAALHKE